MATLTTQLYVVRHAWAEDAGPDLDDHARPLTKKGRKRFERFMKHMRDVGVEIDLIVTSPLVRTRQTAEIMAEVFETPRLEIHDALAPASDWSGIVEWTVEEDAARVAWVGHAPCVGRLIALSIGDGSAAIRMQKGAMASIQLDDGLGLPGELQWLATAQLIEPAL
jgi:phosphohistidine phosphatase